MRLLVQLFDVLYFITSVQKYKNFLKCLHFILIKINFVVKSTELPEKIFSLLFGVFIFL